VTLGPFRHTGEFGIAIADPGARGHGFGREASELRLRFAFDEGGLHRVELHVFDFNEPAKRLYRSLGFRAEGRRREVLYRDGRYHDDVRMAMLVDEYRAREGAAPPPGWIPATLRAAPPGGA
jgi:RimJ/RimL family protein N-acetyltransferase